MLVGMAHYLNLFVLVCQIQLGFFFVVGRGGRRIIEFGLHDVYTLAHWQ